MIDLTRTIMAILGHEAAYRRVEIDIELSEWGVFQNWMPTYYYIALDHILAELRWNAPRGSKIDFEANLATLQWLCEESFELFNK
jgi:hypothetical protein